MIATSLDGASERERQRAGTTSLGWRVSMRVTLKPDYVVVSCRVLLVGILSIRQSVRMAGSDEAQVQGCFHLEQLRGLSEYRTIREVQIAGVRGVAR